MVIQILKWDIHPDKIAAYTEWAKTAIPSILAVPGLVEFRGYRPVIGDAHIVSTFEFADLAAWAAWSNHEDIQRITDELRTFTIKVESELWGPSPVVPEPIRPGR
jgi:antibiotic biosynthesis monooxygenase (ABM) superfamily enzyme